MDEFMFFQPMKFYRSLTIALLDSVDEELADKIPPGFKNSIRWNLGHIYVSHENIALGMTGQTKFIPEGYVGLFEGGTSPMNWAGQPPRLTELRELLVEQPTRIEDQLSGRLSQPAVRPFVIPNRVELNTNGEVLNFALYHEGQHAGFIKGLKKALGITP